MALESRHRMLSALALALPLASLAGCADDPAADGDCVPTKTYFVEQVWGPILSQDCIGCHNPQGEAQDSDMVLLSSAHPGIYRRQPGDGARGRDL